MAVNGRFCIEVHQSPSIHPKSDGWTGNRLFYVIKSSHSAALLPLSLSEVMSTHALYSLQY